MTTPVSWPRPLRQRLGNLHEALTTAPIPAIVVVAGVIGLLVVGVLGEDDGRQPCTAVQPCPPEPIGFTSLGLLLATVVAVFVHRSAARLLSLTFGVVFLVAGLQELAPVWWVQAYVAGFVLACWVVLWPRHGWPATVSFMAYDQVAVPPRPALLPWLRPSTALIGWVFLLVAVATAAAVTSALRQAAGDAREAAAPVVEANVVDQRTFDIRVQVDGEVVPVPATYPSDYPVGTSVLVRIDEVGTVRLVSEPYDASGWLTVTGLAGGLAFAVGWRPIAANLDRLRLFRQMQPMRRVRAVLAGSKVIVLPPSAAELQISTRALTILGRQALVIPAATGRLDGVSKALMGHRVQAAQTVWLHGEAAERAWCAVRVDAETVVPTGPATVAPVVKVLKEVASTVDYMSQYVPHARPDAFGADTTERAAEQFAHLNSQLRELISEYETDGDHDSDHR